MRAVVALLGIALTAGAPAPPICTGCRASVVASAAPVPLLVVLHGDSGAGPAEMVAAWERHARSRGIAVLALACPTDLGCKGSWWQWDGDPAWVSAQVDAFAKHRAIDRSRTWLAGWSGGASYMGMHTQAFQTSFAALVFHGGGIPPRIDGCASGPVYFVVGDRNPLHGLARDLRRHHEACGDEAVWKLFPGADHPAEWRALEAAGPSLIEWLLTKKRHIS